MQIELCNLSDLDSLDQIYRQEGSLKYSPMINEQEIQSAVAILKASIPHGCAFTAMENKELFGVIAMYSPMYGKLTHQATFSIIVDAEKRGCGVGTQLLEAFLPYCKEHKNISIMRLEVYEGNPAIRLYERFGFKKYGEHPDFLRVADQNNEIKSISKIVMYKEL